MFKFTWFVAQRFRHSRRKSGFANFMSSSSTIGIGLGCAVLIVMLSVMNGFEEALEKQLLSKIPHGEIKAVTAKGLGNWQHLIDKFEQDPGVDLIQPFAKITGLAQRGRNTKATDITAIDPSYASLSELHKLVEESVWQRFSQDKHGILLGKRIVDKLQVNVGDKIQLLIPPISDGQQLAKPISVWVKLVGVLELGGELDNFSGFMHLSYAVDTLGIESGAQGLQFTYGDPFVAPQKTRDFAYQMTQAAYISDWTRTQGHLYQDIQLVRVVVYIALLLVIAVACFNIVSSLVMLINEKKPEIDMLLTMGATPGNIVMIFVLQGISNGLKGTLIGASIGTLVAVYLTDIVTWLESAMGFQVLSGDVYFIDYLPSLVLWQDVAITIALALAISFTAVLYSSFKFAKQPLTLR